jgi:hypothetical protein
MREVIRAAMAHVIETPQPVVGRWVMPSANMATT